MLKVKKQFSLDGSSESNSKSTSDDPQETSEPETKRRRTSNVQSAKAAKDSRNGESGDTKRGKASLKIRKPSDKTSGKKKNATAGESPMSSRRNAERERIAKRERDKMKAKEKVLKEQSIKRSK